LGDVLVGRGSGVITPIAGRCLIGVCSGIFEPGGGSKGGRGPPDRAKSLLKWGALPSCYLMGRAKPS